MLEGRSFLKDRRAVSDALVMLLLLAVGAVVVAGIGSVLLTKAPKQTAPVASVAVVPTANGVLIKHEGGDSISYSDVQVMVYSYPSMQGVSNFPTVLNNTTVQSRTEVNPATMFNTGDVRFISLSTQGTYLVELIHTPTQQKIASEVVTVS
ncbi:MAG: type IV pilin [Candidatus Methanoglobus sp.]